MGVSRAVVLFTRDLRAHDHPALAAARAEQTEVVQLFVLDERLLRIGTRRTAYLHGRLDALREAIGLQVVEGDPVEAVARFAPDTVHVSADVSAYARRRAQQLAGRPSYRVFTPYWHVWRAMPLPAPVESGPKLPVPDASLSTHLHLGAVSPAELARAADEELLRNLCWRDFFAQLLAADPALEWRDLHPGRRTWNEDPEAFAAWKEGRTGVDYVDAAMRQLLAEGFIPSRPRMIAASYLTKQLGVDWRLGAAHFMEHLTDGDVATNSGNWQWVAGTGTDTRPNRQFNPERQAATHDADESYRRRWLPERFEPQPEALFE